MRVDFCIEPSGRVAYQWETNTIPCVGESVWLELEDSSVGCPVTSQYIVKERNFFPNENSVEIMLRKV